MINLDRNLVFKKTRRDLRPFTIFSESKNGVKLALNDKFRSQPRFQENETRSRAGNRVDAGKTWAALCWRARMHTRAGQSYPSGDIGVLDG